MNEVLCPNCQHQILPEWYFCPNCGKMIKEKAPTITVAKQALIYFVSFFLSPLGLGWGLKYVRFKDTKTKIVGIVSICLTIASLVAMTLVFKGFMDQYARILDNLQKGQGC